METRLVSFLTIVSLIVFTFYLIPHEVVHVFYDHEDTRHEAEHSNNVNISNLHIHCDFLTTVIADFVAEETQHVNGTTTELPYYCMEREVQTVRCVAILRDLRGPPVA